MNYISYLADVYMRFCIYSDVVEIVTTITFKFILGNKICKFVNSAWEVRKSYIPCCVHVTLINKIYLFMIRLKGHLQILVLKLFFSSTVKCDWDIFQCKIIYLISVSWR